ncbi:MAG: PAS domain S-box protein, partial [Calditrichia bacterium]|nr:PAS domain S-box protein [Calditrichia bacterium]
MKDYESYTILTIDDEEVIRYSFKNFLEDFGYNVIAAENGKKGLAVFNEHKPDLVLVDLRMPVMDGLEVLENLKKNSPDTPVIVVSGTGEIKDVIEALRLGAWDYLLKPVEDLSVLLHTIQKSFERLELIKENRSYQHHLEEKVEQRTQEIFLKNIELKQINNRLRKIVETTKHISLCRDFNQFGIKLLKEFGDHMLAEGGSIYSIEKNGLSLLFSLDPGHAKSFVEFPLKENSILNQVISGKKSLLVKNEEEISAYHGSGWDRYKNSSILAFPLSDEDGNIIAVITLHSKHKPPFIEQDKEIGSILASYSCEVLHTIRANEALQKREEQFRLVIQASYDGMIAINKKGLITIFNPAAEKIFGQKKEDMIGHTLVNLMPKFYRKSHKKNVKSFFSSGKPNNVINKTLQLEALHKNGTILPIELSLSVSKQDDEPFVLGMVRDITKRKQSEEALLKSEEKFKLLFAEIPDALFITSLKEKNKGQILDVNPAAELQTGYNKKELLKMNIVYDLIVEHQDEQFITNNLKKIISGQYIQFVEKKKRKDGEEYWTEVLLSKITINQDDVVLSVNRDITKQKWAQDELIASEHKFRMFTEAAPVAIMIYQGDKFKYVNKESTHITEYSSEELLKMNFWDIIHPDYKELIKTRGMQRQAGEKPESRYEFIIVSKSGKEIWIDFRAETIEYKGQTAVLLTGMDISGRKKGEIQQKITYQIAEAANTAKNSLDLFKIIQIKLNEIIDTTNFIIAFCDKRANMLNIPFMKDQNDHFEQIPMKNTISAFVINENKSVLLSEKEINKIKRKHKIKTLGTTPKSWLGVPLQIDENVSGIIIVQNYEKEKAYTQEDLKLLEFVAHHISTSIKRKQAEDEIRKLSMAVIQNPTAIIITDTGGNIEYVNPKFEKISGYSFLDVKGQNPRILKSGKTSKEEYGQLWKTIKAGKEWRGEFQNKKKNGTLYWEFAHISPIFDDQNKITHYMA